MKASCVICSDLYDQNGDIGSLPCGHVYHMGCINKWMDLCHSCPECRHKYIKKNVNKLYFHYQEPETPSLCSLENDISNLKVQLVEKNLELECQKKKNGELKEYVRIAEENAAKYKQKFLASDSSKKMLEYKISIMNHLEPKIKNLEDQNCQLKEKMKQLDMIENAVSGTRQEVEEMLRTYCGPNASKELATCCSVLKRELAYLTESKKTLKIDLVTKQRKMREMSAQISKLENENKAADYKMMQLEAEAAVLSRKCSALEAGKLAVSQEHSVAMAVFGDTPESPNESSIDGKRPLSPDNQVLEISKTPDIKKICVEPRKKMKVNILPFYVKTLKFPLRDANNCSRNPTLPSLPSSVTSSPSENDDSVTRIGYNGLGGHTKIIQTLGVDEKRNLLAQKKMKKFKPK